MFGAIAVQLMRYAKLRKLSEQPRKTAVSSCLAKDGCFCKEGNELSAVSVGLVSLVPWLSVKQKSER
jgi:hypothetical protein